MNTRVAIEKDQTKLALTATMVALLQVSGHERVRSRISGCPVAPPVIVGTMTSERPDIVSFIPGRRPTLVEAVSRFDMKEPNALRRRLELFYHHALANNWDFHIACYAGLAPFVKRFCEDNMIRYSKLWEI